MAESISQTTKSKKLTLDDVFVEIEHHESMGLPKSEQLRLFYTSMRANKLTYESLQEYLYRNLARYVFSRAKLEDFKINDELDTAVSQAIRVMIENGGSGAAGNMLDEILTYAFLEEELKAPKLMSRVELITDLSQFKSECKGIHLLAPKNMPTNTKYEMVLGASNLVNDLRTAIDQAFEIVLKIDKHESREVVMVQKMSLDRFFDDEDIEVLKASIIPQQRHEDNYDIAYGLFLGYKLGVKAAGRGQEFEDLALKKMVKDIQVHASYIADKIKSNHLDGHSFYVYVVPFNDIDSEKEAIMEPVLKGGVIV